MPGLDQGQPIEVRVSGVTGPGPIDPPSLANPHMFFMSISLDMLSTRRLMIDSDSAFEGLLDNMKSVLGGGRQQRGVWISYDFQTSFVLSHGGGTRLVQQTSTHIRPKQ